MVLDSSLIIMFPGSIHILAGVSIPFLSNTELPPIECTQHICVSTMSQFTFRLFVLDSDENGAVNMHPAFLCVHMFSVILCMYQGVNCCFGFLIFPYNIYIYYIYITYLVIKIETLFYTARHQTFQRPGLHSS